MYCSFGILKQRKRSSIVTPTVWLTDCTDWAYGNEPDGGRYVKCIVGPEQALIFDPEHDGVKVHHSTHSVHIYWLYL